MQLFQTLCTLKKYIKLYRPLRLFVNSCLVSLVTGHIYVTPSVHNKAPCLQYEAYMYVYYSSTNGCSKWYNQTKLH